PVPLNVRLARPAGTTGASKPPFTSKLPPTEPGDPASGRSCRTAVAEPKEQPAAIVTGVGTATGSVTITNVALLDPAGSVTAAGTAAAGLLLVSVTIIPPDPAGW